MLLAEKQISYLSGVSIDSILRVILIEVTIFRVVIMKKSIF